MQVFKHVLYQKKNKNKIKTYKYLKNNNLLKKSLKIISNIKQENYF